MIAGLLTNSGNFSSDRSRAGNKLQMDITGTVTGVDISPHRLATCRSLLKRHRLQQCARLFQADGTTFNVMRPSAIDTIRARIMAGSSAATSGGQSGKRSLEEYEGNESDSAMDQAGAEQLSRQKFHTNYAADDESSAKRQRAALDIFKLSGQQGHYEPVAFNGTETTATRERLVPFYAPKILRNDPQSSSEAYKYDKVIVDAECKCYDGGLLYFMVAVLLLMQPSPIAEH